MIPYKSANDLNKLCKSLLENTYQYNVIVNQNNHGKESEFDYVKRETEVQQMFGIVERMVVEVNALCKSNYIRFRLPESEISTINLNWDD